jgi:four helix bundle protein
MDERALKERTRQFALRVIIVCDALPRSYSADVLGKQVIRSATAVGANYRAACRARTKKEFVYKIGIVEEEADESLYWLELIRDAGLITEGRLEDLIQEADELTAIFTATGRTAKKNLY